MKILFLVNELITVCGVTKHFYHLLSGLKKYHPENKYYVITGGGNAVKKFIDEGFELKVLYRLKHGNRSYYGYLTSILFIYQFVKKYDIDIIHSHHHYAANIAEFVSKLTSVNTIMTNHGLLPEIGKLNHFPSQNIIAVNEHIVDYIISNKIKRPDKIKLIRYGFPIRDINKVKNKKIKIIAGGRFVEEKGFDDYIIAVSLLPDEVKKKADFILAGDGVEKQFLHNLNKKLGSPVEFIGAIENFIEKLKETDIFVMPTKSEAEGFPTVLIEAGITKNLIITTDFRGFNSVFNSNYGLIYEKGNINELSKTINNAIDNYDLYSQKILLFFNKIRKEFSIEKMIRETMELYNKVYYD